MNKLVYFALPKEDVVYNRYRDWGPNHALIDAMYWSTVCHECGGLMFDHKIVEGKVSLVCPKCGHSKPAPDYANLTHDTYESHRELFLARDGFAWLFPSETTQVKHKKRLT